ncbi:MAG: ACP S-malonyltransferase [Proteobacteria bacterium]|nr:ACP S-malonyltransferase [Pseudomonadota bacterium]
MKTYVFPGQGSQVKGMGGTLFDEFKDLTAIADEILGYSIKELCLEDPKKLLHQTQYTQPALYVVNALSYYKKLKETEKKPDFVAGHSLGEYNALLASGVFEFETGLKLVKKRGELMSQASGGAMAAVLGLSEEKTHKILQEKKLTEIDIANLNSPSQIVISGLKEDIDQAQPHFIKEGATYVPLNVSAAFHSRYMQEARDEYEKYIKEVEFSELAIPVISNVHAKPYHQADIVSNLADQLRSSVKWSESIQFLMDQGEMEIEELGVGDVLTKLIKTIQEQTSPVADKNETKANQNSETTDENDNISEEEVELTETLMPKTESDMKPHSFSEENETEFPQNVKSAVEEEANTTGEDIDSLKEDVKKAYKQQIEELHKKIETWNKTYPLGTKVSVEGYDEELKTRTEAMVLFGHRAAIYMKGYNGYFALDEVTPV